MEKEVSYDVRFDVPTLERAVAEMQAAVGGNFQSTPPSFWQMSVRRGREIWRYDDHNEFLADFGQPHDESWVSVNVMAGEVSPMVGATLSLAHHVYSPTTVRVSNASRPIIARTMRVFDEAVSKMPQPAASAPEPKPRPRIFIGHGGKSSAWRDLKDHLADKHHYEVRTFESGARAGHTVRDILEDELGDASFAILMFTAEDEQADGQMRARQNVIHEAGLFQGKLGFPRAVVILENGVENLSNLDGVQYIGYTHTVAETFGEVLATLKREFD